MIENRDVRLNDEKSTFLIDVMSKKIIEGETVKKNCSCTVPNVLISV